MRIPTRSRLVRVVAALALGLALAIGPAAPLFPAPFPLAPLLSAPVAHAATLSMPGNMLGLVGYWTFDEGAGTTAADHSGSGDIGTLQNAPVWTNGKFGSSLSLNGTNQYVSLSPGVSLPVPFTISVWVKWNGGVAITGGTSNGSPELRIQVSGEIELLREDVQSEYVSNAAIPSNVWAHVVLVYEGATTYCYIDGVLDSNTTSTNVTFSSPLNIFGKNGGNNAEYFNGAIDDLRIYNRALSAAEVADLYQAGEARMNKTSSPGSLSSGLVGHWTFDGPDMINNVADTSGQDNTGYLVGYTSTTTVPGVLGQALSFNGSNQYVSLANNLASNLSGGKFTLTAWVKTASISGTQDTIIKNWGGLNIGAFHFDISSGKLRLYVGESNGTQIGPTEDSTALNTNTWYFVSAEADGSNIEIYKNGTQVGTPVAYNGTLKTSFAYTNIGCKPGDSGGCDSGNPGYFPGTLDDVRIYNRALSASEVKQLYNLGTGTHGNASGAALQEGTTLASGLMGYWTFDGPDLMNNVADMSGQGNTGYLVNAATSSQKTIGVLGQALSFNGSNQYVSTKAVSTFMSASDGSISAWLYPTGTAPSVTNPYNGRSAVTDFSGYMGIYRANIGGLDRIWAYNWHAGTQDVGVTYTPNQWVHIVWVHTGGMLYIYKNGILGGSVASGNTDVMSGTLGIGRGYGAYWQGYIDDVRVYDRALSASEVKQLYKLGR